MSTRYSGFFPIGHNLPVWLLQSAGEDVMGLADRLNEEMVDTPLSGCTVGRIRAALEQADREALDHAVRLIRANTAPRNQFAPMTAAKLHRVLKADGRQCGIDAVQAHVYGRCSCKI